MNFSIALIYAIIEDDMLYTNIYVEK